MYNVDLNCHKPREDIKQAFEECIAHADALLEFYDSIYQSLKLTPQAFVDGKLSDDAKYLVFYCRQQLQAVSLEISQREVNSDQHVWFLLKQLRLHCEDDIKEIKLLRDALSIEKPTMARANLYHIALQSSKKNHIKKLNYMMDDVSKSASNKKFITNRSYARIMKTNSTSEFFTDSISTFGRCVDDVSDKYNELVTYEFKLDEEDEAHVSYQNMITAVNFQPLVKVLNILYAEYLVLKEFVADNKNWVEAERVDEYIAKVDSHLDLKGIMSFVDSAEKRVSTLESAEVQKFSFEIIVIVSNLMRMSNVLESAVKVLTDEKSYIQEIILLDSCGKILASLKDAVDLDFLPLQTEEAILTEVHPQIAVLSNPGVAPVEATTSVDDDHEAYEQNHIKIDKNVKSKNKHAADNLKRVKSFDKYVLAMFFKTPPPHFEMSEKQFFKFMVDIGAKVNDSSGNGSAVKISLDPQSVLIAPAQDLTRTAMNIHKQHNSGHKVKDVPSYVIKNALKFFERAGLYDYLYAEYQKDIELGLSRKNKI